jgi:DNA polymerase-3 subunit delta'
LWNPFNTMAETNWKEPPQHCFDTITGHDLIKQYLQSAGTNGILPHAILFGGPKGVGKLSTAYALAKAVNCRRGAPGNCPCETCRKISEQVFADIRVVEPAGAANQITLSGWKEGKDDPDGLQHYRFVDSRPLEGTKKVLIIRQADRMNVGLSNYLLKLIEEPPSYLLIILVTHRPADLLITIRSRCAPLRFSPLTRTEMEIFGQHALQKVEAAQLSALIRLSEGRPGLLHSLAAGAGQQHAEVARIMKLFQQHGFLSLFRVASDLQNIAEGKKAGAEQFEQVLTAIQAWLRDSLILKNVGEKNAPALLIHSDVEADLRAYAETISTESLSEAAAAVHQAYQYVPRQMDRGYVLETLLLKAGRAMRRAV